MTHRHTTAAEGRDRALGEIEARKRIYVTRGRRALLLAMLSSADGEATACMRPSICRRRSTRAVWGPFPGRWPPRASSGRRATCTRPGPSATRRPSSSGGSSIVTLRCASSPTTRTRPIRPLRRRSS